jgi:uncharacterized OB-fold protein
VSRPEKSKPLPIPNQDTEPFWQGCARGELLLQKCSPCGHYRHPPSPICPACLSPHYRWTASSGRGTVYSFVVVHRALHPAWEKELPYVVAIIELAEGPHLMSNVVETPVDQVKIGMNVEVFFERASEEIAVPKFRRIDF